ncbi:MAG: M48 family metalloprotease [Saprospiraceae bacterium]|nr:M48 family metalloprotease [Saprospiraceae bacterium]
MIKLKICKIIIIKLIAIFLTFPSFGQNYQPFDTVDHGNIDLMADIYERKFDKIIEEITVPDKKLKTAIKNIYKSQKDFFLDEIKDRVFIYDNKITKYLTEILENILRVNNIPLDGYKILLSGKDEINAYNLGEGSIVIHYGLINFLNNEDQLYSIICHEVGHQILEHVKTHIFKNARQNTSDEVTSKTKNISKKKYGRSREAQDFINKLRFNNYRSKRKSEIQADSLGFILYSKTDRNKFAFLSTLKELNDTDIERDSISKEDLQKIFNFDDSPFLDKWLKIEDNSIFNYDNIVNYNNNINNDSLKTHPSCIERISLIKSTYKSDFESIDSITFSKSQEFSFWKKDTELQTLYNLFSNENYGKSLYKSILYLKKYPHSIEAKLLISESLKKLAIAKSNYRLNNYIPNINPKENSASLNLFINFVQNLRISEMELLSSKIVLN